jgi:hypothetical protein
MKRKWLTDKQYVKKNGGVCPHCGEDQIEGESVEIDGGEATQDVSCLGCGATWTDLYKLVGYIGQREG